MQQAKIADPFNPFQRHGLAPMAFGSNQGPIVVHAERSRKDDDRECRSVIALTKMAEEFPAVHHGHSQIEQGDARQRRGVVGQPLQGLGSVRGSHGFMAQDREQFEKAVSDIRVVFDDKDFAHFNSYPRWSTTRIGPRRKERRRRSIRARDLPPPRCDGRPRRLRIDAPRKTLWEPKTGRRFLRRSPGWPSPPDSCAQGGRSGTGKTE